MLFLLVLLYMIPLGSFQSVNDCPAGVPRDSHLQVHGGFCFQFVLTHKVSHTDARADCERHNGTLALLKTQEIQNFIYDQLAHTYKDFSDKVWIGLNDIASEDHFVWEDGTNVTYSNWANGEAPNSGSFQHALQHNNEDCVILDMSSGGKWHDYSCDSNFVFLFSAPEKHSYVCQYPLGAGVSFSTAVPVSTTPTLTTVLMTQSTTVTSDTPTTTVVAPQSSSVSTVNDVVEPNSPTTVSVLVNPCPALSCDLDCWTSGFKKDPQTGCVICECETKK